MIYLKVITEKGGVKAHSVNDRSIEHSISQKTELFKKNEKALSGKTERTVRRSEKDEPVPHDRGNPVQTERRQFAERKEHASGKAADRKIPLSKSATAVGSPRTEIKTSGSSEKITPTPFRPPKQYKLSPHQPKNKKYKVLKNGTVANGTLTKRKERVIYSQQQNKKLRKIKRKKIDKSRLKLLKSLNRQQKKIFRKKAELISIAMGGVTPAKVDITKYRRLSSAAKTAANIAAKPAEVLKKGFVAQAEKSDDNGVKAAKLGVQIYDHGASGIKTAANAGVKTAKNGSKITKRVYRKIHKPTSAELRRKLRKRVNHNITAEAKFLAKRAVKKGAAKAGKTAAQTAKTAAKAAQKATQAAGKAIAGGGAWLVDDNSNQTPEQIYEGYKEFIEQAKDVMEKQAKDALKDTVTGFCDGDTTAPRKIIQYIDKSHNNTFYPAKGADRTINSWIDAFGTDDYADYMSLLFVLMTREKQQADGVSDGEIYDFDFKREDFEEFMKSVNQNYCRWGDTFVYKTAVETSPVACPGENCKTKYKSDRCAYYTDDDGHKHYYCKGHPYCPINHTKLTVKLYTVKDYYNEDYPEIYDFTDNEKARYQASKAIIQSMLDYWEGGIN